MPATTSGVEDSRNSEISTAGRFEVPDLSLVVPCKDEAGNLPRLIDEIEAALTGQSFELVIVDDGSVDATAGTVVELARDRPWLRLVSHADSAGQSFALRSGLLAARGPVVVTRLTATDRMIRPTCRCWSTSCGPGRSRRPWWLDNGPGGRAVR